MTAPMPEVETPAAVAARWFARRRRGLAPEEAAELAGWMEADAGHAAAYLRLETAWRDVETMRDDPAIMAMRAEALAPPARPSRALIRRGLAAALAIGVLAGAAGLGGLFDHGRAFSNQTFRTSVGQRAAVTLPDGSVVTLNTDSVVRTRAADDGRRLIYLDKGQAFFKVAKDKTHPFVVTAAGRTITALGTAFDVRVDDGRTFEVTLVEGKVRVEAPAPPPLRARAASPEAAPAPAPASTSPMQAIEMTAGAQLTAADGQGGPWNLTRADVARETSWVSGQLVFYSEPLTKVVAELNRYSEKKIVLEEGDFAARPISGTFRAGDVETFVKGLETYRLARVEADGRDEIRLAAP